MSRAILTAPVLSNEMTQLLGKPAVVELQQQFGMGDDYMLTVSSQGHKCQSIISLEDLAGSLDEFSNTILLPMVDMFRAATV